jgi:hypothetical protein
MVILTDCPLFEPSCPGRIGWLTPRSLNVWSSLYHAEIHMDPFFADHRVVCVDSLHFPALCAMLRTAVGDPDHP